MALMFSCAVFVLWKNTSKNRHALETWTRNSFSVFLSSPPAILGQFPFLSFNNTKANFQTSSYFPPFPVQGKTQTCSHWALPPPLPCESDSRAYIMCAFWSMWFLLGHVFSFPSLVLPELGAGRRGSEDRSAAAHWLPIWQGKLPAFALIDRKSSVTEGSSLIEGLPGKRWAP